MHASIIIIFATFPAAIYCFTSTLMATTLVNARLRVISHLECYRSLEYEKPIPEIRPETGGSGWQMRFRLPRGYMRRVGDII